MNLVAKVLVENPGVVVLRNKNDSDWDVFKLQFGNDSSSPQSSFIFFAFDDQEIGIYQLPKPFPPLPTSHREDFNRRTADFMVMK